MQFVAYEDTPLGSYFQGFHGLTADLNCDVVRDSGHHQNHTAIEHSPLPGNHSCPLTRCLDGEIVRASMLVLGHHTPLPPSNNSSIQTIGCFVFRLFSRIPAYLWPLSSVYHWALATQISETVSLYHKLDNTLLKTIRFIQEVEVVSRGYNLYGIVFHLDLPSCRPSLG